MKNITFALQTFLFGTAAAISSNLSPEPVYVRAIMNEDSTWECLNTQTTCQAAGASICVIVIPLKTGGQEAAQSNLTPLIYQSGCIQVFYSSDLEIKTSPLTGNERPYRIL